MIQNQRIGRNKTEIKQLKHKQSNHQVLRMNKIMVIERWKDIVLKN